MIFKSFRLNVVIRVILLSLTLYGFFFLMLKSNLHATMSILAIFSILQIFSLLRYVQQTNVKLSNFLNSIKYEDFSQTYVGEGLGSSFDDLKLAFNNINEHYRKTRAEKEENYQYLQTVIKHIGIALIAYDLKGNVELINSPAKQLFGVTELKNIESLKSFSEELLKTLFNIKSRTRELVQVQNNDELLQLSIYATKFRLRQKEYILVSIQDIQSELESAEMKAWQSLIRVLTHEIMNSITPISSLAATVSNILSDGKQELKGEIDLEDIKESIQTIHGRSKGLLEFVNKYRDLTNIPEPKFKIVPVTNIFSNVQKLMQKELQDEKITFVQKIDPDSLKLTADSTLIEQVIINLIINALNAVANTENGSIKLTGQLNSTGRALIQVEDNGSGMSSDIRDKIFIPFFTTKKEGSGIGLSLSRQIMRAHGGGITVHSEVNQGTTITLKF